MPGGGGSRRGAATRAAGWELGLRPAGVVASRPCLVMHRAGSMLPSSPQMGAWRMGVGAALQLGWEPGWEGGAELGLGLLLSIWFSWVGPRAWFFRVTEPKNQNNRENLVPQNMESN